MKQCTCVRVQQYPDVLEWEFDDGSTEVTDDLDLNTVAGRHMIAARAIEFGVAGTEEKEVVVGYLEIITADAGDRILPMNLTGC